MKLHIGCGTVYLDGWLNLDVPGPNTFLAEDRLDLVESLRTTDAKYYARHADKTLDVLRAGPLKQEYVCDVYGDFGNLPPGDCDEVLARHSFEHLSITEARRALDRLKRYLPKGGVLRLDVPDHEATLKLFAKTKDEFYIRHLLGPRRGDYGFHMMSYTRERLTALVEEYGFKFVAEEPNIHFFPAFCLRFEKDTSDLPVVQGPRDYVKLPEIPADWQVLDVGPGAFPLLRADVYADRDPAILRALKVNGRKVVCGLEGGLEGIADKSFDFVWCSHVLEHVEDPVECAKTLSRVGKRGVIVLPSFAKEAIFNFEESTHLWEILPNPKDGGPPIFVRQNKKYIQALRDADIQKAACFLYRTGTHHDCTVENYMQSWFVKNELHLDVVYFWENDLKLLVIP